MELHPGQQVVGRLKAVDLALLLIKGADHAHTGQVLAGQAQHTVQPGLGRFVQRVGDDHDPEHHHAQQRDGDHKDPGGPHIHGERMIMAPTTTNGLRRNRRRKRFRPLCT